MRSTKIPYKELESRLVLLKSGAEAPPLPDAPEEPLSPGPRRIRVLVVDDHEITRRWLFQLIQHQPDMEVVGLALDGRTAIATTRLAHPRVVLLDYEMDGMSGPEVTRRIMAEFPQTKIICLSMYDEETAGSVITEAGAIAYLEKGCPSEDLLAAVRGCTDDLGFLAAPLARKEVAEL